jgi:hypothetical protein
MEVDYESASLPQQDEQSNWAGLTAMVRTHRFGQVLATI